MRVLPSVLLNTRGSIALVGKSITVFGFLTWGMTTAHASGVTPSRAFGSRHWGTGNRSLP